MATAKDVLDRAKILVENGEIEKAKKFYQAVIDRMPESEKAKTAKSCLDKLNRPKEADFDDLFDTEVKNDQKNVVENLEKSGADNVALKKKKINKKHKKSRDKVKKPFYKRWWFWVLVVLALIIVGSLVDSGNDANEIKGDVKLSVKITKTDAGKYKVSGTTNLPDGYELMVTLSNQEEYMTNVMHLPADTGGDQLTDDQFNQLMDNSYLGNGNYKVKNGKYKVTFSGNNLNPGNYDLRVFGPKISTQTNKDELKKVLGDKGEKLTGKFTKTNKATGEKYVELEKTVELK